MHDYIGVLEWCFHYHYSHDHAKSAERLGPLKYSPLTARLAIALSESISVKYQSEVEDVLSVVATKPTDQSNVIVMEEKASE